MRHRNLVTKVAIGAIVSIVATVAHGQDQGNTMRNMQTLCIGRYLVEIPFDAELWGKDFNFEGNKFIINDATKENVQEHIKKTRENILKDGDRYYIHKEINSDVSSAIAYRVKNYKKYGTELGFDLIAHRWMLREYLLKSTADGDKLDLAFSSLQRVINGMQSLRPKEIPIVPGFCLTGAFIPGAPQEEGQYEYAFMSFRPRSHPDVKITIQTRTVYKKEEKSLLERNPDSAFMSFFSGELWRIKHLRSGKRNVKDMPGEEVMDAIKTDNGGISHVARWETEGQLGAATHPMIVVELETASKAGQVKYANSSLNNEQAMALFDAVVNSIRLRPVSQ